MDPTPEDIIEASPPTRPLLIEANVIAYFGDLIKLTQGLATSGHITPSNTASAPGQS
jgi:hypothetical protein